MKQHTHKNITALFCKQGVALYLTVILLWTLVTLAVADDIEADSVGMATDFGKCFAFAFGHVFTMGWGLITAESQAGYILREPFNTTPMGADPISSGYPHVRCTPMWALSTCGEPDETKKNTHPT